MKKVPVIAAFVIFAALLAVLAVSFVKNNKIEYKGSTAANSVTESAEAVADETESVVSSVADTLTDAAESTSVNEPGEAVTSFREEGSSNTATTISGALSGIVTDSSATTKASETTKASGTTKADSTTSSSTYEYSYAGFNPTFVTVPTSEKELELFLVNRDYVISSDYTPKLEYAVTGDTSSKKLDYRVAPHYNEMYQAALKDGITLTTVSGYRSYSLQKTNFERKIQTYMNNGETKVKATQDAAKIILPPGTSEHNVGLAMDIISLEQNFENTKAFEWLQKNAADYGFILRYPKDKQDVTKIIYEPWHWRYVGVANAKAIKASGKCLEEYLGKA